MALIAPLNDKGCLRLLHDEAQRYAGLPAVHKFAAQFRSLAELIDYIRHLEQRDDIGDPEDGPRLACNLPQRMRFAPSAPNCFERTALYLALAEILAPDAVRSSASLVIDDDWHTFPVEIRNGLPEAVVLDPVSPPRNVMLATAYSAQRVAPGTRNHLAPWFTAMARNACFDDGGEDRYERAVGLLRNSLLTGEPIDELEDFEDLDYVLELAGDEAELWGAHGRAACKQVDRSIRNLSLELDTNLVSKIVRKVVKTGEKLAPAALKAALVSQFGPAAAVALEGVDIAIEQNESAAKPDATPNEKAPKVENKDPKVGTLQLRLESSPTASEREQPKNGRLSPKELLRRMSLAFRSAQQTTK